MRGALVTAVLLALAPLLAGCLETTDEPPAPTGPPTPTRPAGRIDRIDATPIAFHQWFTCGFCGPGFNDRLFVVFEDGHGLLVNYTTRLPEDAQTQVDSNVTFNATQLRDLLVGTGSVREGDAARVDAAVAALLPRAEFDALRAALRDDWGAPTPPPQPTCADCEGFGTYGLQDNGTWTSFSVYEVDKDAPSTAAFLRLDAAFRRAEAALDDSRQPLQPPTSTLPPPSPSPPVTSCVAWRIDVQPPGLYPGQHANITAHLRNTCDFDIQVQGTNGCSMRGVEAALLHNGTRYMLGRGAATTMQVCTMIYPGPVTIAAGDELVETWSWNGTLVRPNADTSGEYVPAQPGAYDVEVWIVKPADMPRGTAQVHVNGPPSGTPVPPTG